MDGAIGARNALLLACAALLAMLFLIMFNPDGAAAVTAIGGLVSESAPNELALRLALACDTVLPIGYASGFCLLAFALGNRAAEPSNTHVMAIVLMTALGVGADFVENGAALADQSLTQATVLKFGALGVALHFLGHALDLNVPTGRILRLLLCYVTPLFLAVVLSGLAGALTLWLFVLTLLGSFLMLAYYANGLAKDRTV